ncbi:DUF4179 domain-containing protein [Bacillus sp. FJAT-22090]|uniref:DUF4179 domain-containing protein n=1 Tax=Bacillus sp. FJAT-22090 TaxID=1581038 RepID=UPI0011AA8D06|nr:DUF4179 domain-containing protein [Bacillus sp. FJAT-22090]
MDKDIKKSIDSIQVPRQKLDAAIKKGLNVSQKQIKPRRKKVVMLILSCAATFGLLISLGFISPTMASVLARVPLLDSIFTSVGDKGLRVAIRDENAILLNETISSNGVSFKVQEVVYDGTRLAFSFVQDKAEYLNLHQIEVNGEEINFSSSTRGEYLENGQFSGLVQIYPTESLPKEFDLNVSIIHIGDTRGDWQFETHVLQTNNHRVNLGIGQRAELDNFSYEVKKFESTNSAISLHVLFKETPEAMYNPKKQRLELYLLDQKGNPIPMISASGSGIKKGLIREYVFEPISEEVSELTISPFFVPEITERKENIEILDKNSLPLIISQGEMGDLVVTRMEEENDLTAVYFESTSSFPFGTDFEMNHLWVGDSEGNYLIADGGYPKSIGKNKYKMYINSTKDNGEIIIKTINIPKMTLNQEAQITVKIPR